MSVIIKSGASGNTANVNDSNQLSVSVDNIGGLTVTGIGVSGTVAAIQSTTPWVIAPNIAAQSLTAGVDGYERLRIASPVSIFETDYTYYATGDLTTQAAPLFNFAINGSGTVVRPAFEPCALLTVGTDSGASVLWQTKAYFPAQVGKGLQVTKYGLIGGNTLNVTKRIGFYDDYGGWFFEQNGTTQTMRVVIRSSVSGSPVDTGINQSNWNIDKMDGTGPSHITLDFSKYQVFVIDSGALRVRFGVFNAGVLYYVHQGLAANIATAVFTSASSFPFPVRVEIINSAVSTGDFIKIANAGVIVDGGFEDSPTAFAFSVNTADTLVTINSPPVPPAPILSIRPALLLAGRPNHAFITLRDYGIISGGQLLRYQLVYNGTLTGSNFEPTAPISGVEYDIAATAISGGTVVDSGYMGAISKEVAFLADKFPFRLPFTINLTGTASDIYTIVVSALGGGTVMAGANFKWQELR
jgi:hypothetical protein